MIRAVRLFMAVSMLFAGLLGEQGHLRAHADEQQGIVLALEAERAWLAATDQTATVVVFENGKVHAPHTQDDTAAHEGHAHPSVNHGFDAIVIATVILVRQSTAVKLPNLSVLNISGRVADGIDRPPRNSLT